MDSTENELSLPRSMTRDPRPTSTSSQRFRTMVRQNSMKIGVVAEVMLPMNRRSLNLKRTHGVNEDVPDSIELESQLPVKTTVEVPVKKFPIFIITISLIQVMTFIFGDVNTILALCYDPFRRHEIWRYFTEMLVHKTLGHMLGNVIFQLILGLLLEIVHHWKRISAIYMAGVLGGALAVTVLDPLRYSLGASAGVYGLLLAHLATIILNWGQMDRIACRLFWLLLYIAYDVGIVIYVQFVRQIDSQVSHAGHVGGALGGFIAAVFVLRNFEKLAWEKLFQKILLGISVLLLVTVVIINVAFPSHYFPTEYNFDYLTTFLRYTFKTMERTAEFIQMEQDCLADPECVSLLGDLLNSTQTPSQL